MPKPQPYLSKTKYVDGVKCTKLLWSEYNRRDLIAPPDVALQAIFDQGVKVGELAQKLYPSGIKVQRQQKPENTHAKTMEAAKLRRPLFEAGLIYGRTYALPDILVPVVDDAWDLIEVKSSTHVEDVYLIDVAFQKYVYSGAGLKIRRCYLMHINNEYVRSGEIEPKKLLIKEDVTEAIKPFEAGLEKSIKTMLTVMAGKEPEAKVGPFCDKPYDCPLEAHCWKFLPEGDLFQLRGKKERLYALMDQGVLKLVDIPIDDTLNEKQLIQIDCHKTGKAHVDGEGIKEFLSQLEYPLYLLDFETISPAIPAYDLTRPFEKVTFQYSLHVIQKEGASPTHYGYLAPGDIDPRPEVLAQLKKLLGDTGTILAYNMSFEIGCIKKAVEAYPEYEKWFEKLERRFVDLIVPFRSFYYYHPAQAGSCSIKYVLPAMTKTSYKGMEIADGELASIEYARVTFGENIEESDRQKVRQALEAYCKLDTQAMVDILGKLKEHAKC